jgi:hypothetical protein
MWIQIAPDTCIRRDEIKIVSIRENGSLWLGQPGGMVHPPYAAPLLAALGLEHVDGELRPVPAPDPGEVEAAIEYAMLPRVARKIAQARAPKE